MASLKASEREVEELKTDNTARPKVAFSASLANLGNVGRFNTDITLVHNRDFNKHWHSLQPYFRFTDYDPCTPACISVFHRRLLRGG